ncbi:MAG: cobalt-precorrin-6A reductase [Alphaproteobacteria bacterium]
MTHQRVLILGGTTEASAIARALVDRPDLDAILSLAGRTEAPTRPPIAHRIGGFGGIEGLIAYLKSEAITGVIDATHPFAAQMTRHAAEACTTLHIPRLIFTRPEWRAEEGDHWQSVSNIDAAVDALGTSPRRVFLTVGRLSLSAFRRADAHVYLVRSIDQPAVHEMPRNTTLVLARGPFSVDDEIALMRAERIDVLVTKNSGGAQTDAKLAAARALRIPVIMVERPALPESRVTYNLEEALAFIGDHGRAP